jgi:RNA polymerase sigma-70 factor (ECF subfamily)
MMADEPAGTILARCTRQDPAAFAVLFEQHHLRVFRNAFVLTHSTDAAEEITQLVFIELFTAIRRFDPARPFLPWFYRIIHNVSMDYLKRIQRRRECVLPEMPDQIDALIGPDPGADPLEHVQRAEQEQEMWQALMRLSLDHRAVLVLRYYDGLSVPEIAETLQCRAGTVKSRLHRAEHALMREFAGEEAARSASAVVGTSTRFRWYIGAASAEGSD